MGNLHATLTYQIESPLVEISIHITSESFDSVPHPIGNLICLGELDKALPNFFRQILLTDYCTECHLPKFRFHSRMISKLPYNIKISPFLLDDEKSKVNKATFHETFHPRKTKCGVLNKYYPSYQSIKPFPENLTTPVQINAISFESKAILPCLSFK